MKELLQSAANWFYDQHPLAKVAWILGIIVIPMMLIPMFFGSDFTGTTENRTERAKATLERLEQLGSGSGGVQSDSDIPDVGGTTREEALAEHRYLRETGQLGNEENQEDELDRDYEEDEDSLDRDDGGFRDNLDKAPD